MGMTTHYFLGANSGSGFQSIFDRFCFEEHDDLLVLKGGPGGGKSTMMRRIAGTMEQMGEDIEYLHCSGDPDSLDGISIPRIRTAIVDGTSPHMIEPKYHAVKGRYADLGRFCNDETVKRSGAEIIKCTDACSRAYQSAYRSLNAARNMRMNACLLAGEGLDREKMYRRTAGIVGRELRGKGQGTVECFRFLESVTCMGVKQWFDSVATLCPKIYCIQDRYGLSAPMMAQIRGAVKEHGYSAVICPDPEQLNRTKHILLPELGTAFLSVQRDEECCAPVYRRIHLDGMIDALHLRQWKGRLRFLGKMEKELLRDAINSLKKAKNQHDALEKLYRPHVDFAEVDALTDREIDRIIKLL